MNDFQGISAEARGAYQRLEAMTGGPLRVNSGYRSPEHNARVGGAKNSQHMHGNAFDVDVSNLSRPERVELIRQARQSGFRGVGVYENSLHFDVGAERAWGPSYSRDSLPEWAVAGLNPLEPPAARSEAPMNRLALLQAMPKWQNSLSAEDFTYGV